jgi:hypothetical protein
MNMQSRILAAGSGTKELVKCYKKMWIAWVAYVPPYSRANINLPKKQKRKT